MKYIIVIIFFFQSLHVLFEYSIGYCLFKVNEFENVGSQTPQVEAAISEGHKFKKAVKLLNFKPFTNAAECLANANAVSEGNFSLSMQCNHVYIELSSVS